MKYPTVFPVCAVTGSMAKANVFEHDVLEDSFMIDPEKESKLSPQISPITCLPPTTSDTMVSCEGGVHRSLYTVQEPNKQLESFGGTQMSRKH